VSAPVEQTDDERTRQAPLTRAGSIRRWTTGIISVRRRLGGDAPPAISSPAGVSSRRESFTMALLPAVLPSPMSGSKVTCLTSHARRRMRAERTCVGRCASGCLALPAGLQLQAALATVVQTQEETSRASGDAARDTTHGACTSCSLAHMSRQRRERLAQTSWGRGRRLNTRGSLISWGAVDRAPAETHEPPRCRLCRC